MGAGRSPREGWEATRQKARAPLNLKTEMRTMSPSLRQDRGREACTLHNLATLMGPTEQKFRGDDRNKDGGIWGCKAMRDWGQAGDEGQRGQ